MRSEDMLVDVVHVDSKLGTVVWPNGADLDPVVLRAAVQGGNGSAATR